MFSNQSSPLTVPHHFAVITVKMLLHYPGHPGSVIHCGSLQITGKSAEWDQQKLTSYNCNNFELLDAEDSVMTFPGSSEG